jgi:hypothetical protein
MHREDVTSQYMIDIYIHNDELTFNEPLHEHTGALNFATDTWTSPNHKMYMAVRGYMYSNTLPEWGIQASYLGCFGVLIS